MFYGQRLLKSLIILFNIFNTPKCHLLVITYVHFLVEIQCGQINSENADNASERSILYVYELCKLKVLYLIFPNILQGQTLMIQITRGTVITLS